MIVRPGVPEELRWFAAARFGMFVHFGVYALLGRGEWVMYHERIPRDQYRALAARFDPSAFDADEWVDLATAAGARYLTCTAKHHDGFCLFDSALTDWKITHTPFGRDLIGELVAACQRRGLPIVLYYSQPDWMHPAFANRFGAFKDWPEPRPEDAPDWEAYVAYYLGQVRELCTNYGRIDGIWFDGSHRSLEDWRGDQVYDLIKRLQPHAVVNDRARRGDFFTPERHLPDDLAEYLFEACESTSPTSWGYQGDSALYSVPHLVGSLVKVAAAGGNLLLNVGPAPDGTIPAGQAERMRGVGRWLACHGEAIHGTGAGPVLPDPQLRVTVRGSRAYVHLLAWPRTDRLVLPGLGPDDLEQASLLGGPELTGAAAAGEDGGLELRGLPGQPGEAGVEVIRLVLRRVPAAWCRPPAATPAPPAVAVSPAAPTRLRPEDAAREGRGVKGAPLRLGKDAASGETFLGGWMAPEQRAWWAVEVAHAGAYGVEVVVRPPRPGQGGATLAVLAGADRLTGAVPDGDALRTFQTIALGRVRLPAGPGRVTLEPAALKWGYLLGEVAAVILRPAPP